MYVLFAESCPSLCDPMDCSPTRLLYSWNSPGKNTRVGSYSLLQGIFLTKRLNVALLHCRQILYPLSHQRNSTPSKLNMNFLKACKLSSIWQLFPWGYHKSTYRVLGYFLCYYNSIWFRGQSKNSWMQSASYIAAFKRASRKIYI